MTDKILLVDDDPALCSLLEDYLSGEGFTIAMVHDGQMAIEQIHQQSDLQAVVLDIMMPQVSGLEVLKTVRQSSDIPVIMLTGRGDEIDRILGLEMGADDYLGKPCNPRELAARLKAVLRRHKPRSTNSAKRIALHNIELDTGMLEVKANGKALSLTHAEFHVLQLLLESAGQVLTKEELTEQVLSRKLTAYDRSIDVHVSRIRQKLLQTGIKADLIKTVRGVGYQMSSGAN